MSIQHELMSKEGYAAALTSFAAKADEFWQFATILIVDAIMAYHVHSYDTSRLRQAHELFAAKKMSNMTPALARVLSLATGTSSPNWKHNAKLLAGREREWEDVVKELEVKGLAFYKPDAPAKVASINKAKTLKIPSEVSDEIKNALTKHFDSVLQVAGTVGDAEALAMLTGTGGLPPFKSATLRGKYVRFGEVLVEMESHTELVDGPQGPEVGIDKALRLADTAYNGATNALKEDFKALVAANDSEVSAAAS